mgnify:FL=1
MLEDIKPQLGELKTKLDQMGESLEVPAKEEKIAELEYKMGEPTFWDDAEKAQKINQELNDVKISVDKYKNLVAKFEDAQTLWEMGMEEQDESMEEDVKSELAAVAEGLESLQLEVLLSGPYDANNAILTLHAGAGGTEAQDWTQMLLRMYGRWAERHGFTVETADLLPGDEAGVKSATLFIKGHNAYGFLRSEKGIHRLVRISPFDAQARRHTSFAACDIMPEIDDAVEVDINMADVRVDTYRASGAGGQHINKTSSAIRVTHLPTGMVVECQDQRSQRENKDRALKVLRSRLLQQKQDAYDEEYNARRQSQVGSGDRSEKIRTYNFPQDRVTDHRIGLTLRNLQGVLDGDLDRVVEPLILADREEKLKQSSTEEGK